MKTGTLILIGAVGVGVWYMMKSAPASTTARYLDGLGRPIPWWQQREQYGRGPGFDPSSQYASPYGYALPWQPYSPSAAFGPSPVEIESPGSLSLLASQIDAGMY